MDGLIPATQLDVIGVASGPPISQRGRFESGGKSTLCLGFSPETLHPVETTGGHVDVIHVRIGQEVDSDNGLHACGANVICHGSSGRSGVEPCSHDKDRSAAGTPGVDAAMIALDTAMLPRRGHAGA
jgi:hypothetical protein